MLSNQHFYYRLTRKYSTLFSDMFNNITVKHKDVNDVEVRRIKVPIIWGPKDKYVTRLQTDPDLLRDVAITLPRMSYDITGWSYDPSRKQISTLRVADGDTASRVKSAYMAVPYNLKFQLSIYSKTIDDGLQITEQILPYFNPDYTRTIVPIPELSFLKDIPIILDGVNQQIDYEGNYDKERFCIWNLDFTMQCYYFGPITTPKIIRKSIANIFNDPSLVTGYITRINTDLPANCNTFFAISDTVYQGSSWQTATAYGQVLDWDSGTRKLMLGGVQGNFILDSTIRAQSTNASCNIASFDASPLKLAQIIVQPDPIDATPESEYGYSIDVSEFPNIANT